MSFSSSYNTTNPGGAVGNREDLSDGISMLEPQETPVYSMLPKVKATATFHEWVVDDLEDPSTSGVSENADVTTFDDKFSNRVRLGNYIHTLRRTFGVSRIQEAAESVGPAAYAQAEMKATLEIKRDAEAVVLGTQDRQAQTGAGSPYLTRGLGDWIDSAGPADVPADYRTPSDSIHVSGVFTESILQTIIGSIFTQRGMVQNMSLVASVALRKVINENFTRAEGTTTDTNYEVVEQASTKTVTYAVDIFDSNFGRINIVNANPKCLPSGVNGYLINPEYAAVANYIPMGSEEFPDLGAGRRGAVDTTFALVCKHPAAHGIIKALS